ncbi:response regulator [Vreelandella massiliensis]|uniref:response regulator n=1 Tax=Vreelandella massiliensis TaxID=1816686 RepID=UPI00096A940B|nr:response regulator [Halomonas massiliensis]
MQGYHRQEHFWNAIMWPILWPWLLAQLALVGLCLIVGLVVWGLNPEEASWGTVVAMMAALLLGSSLNAGAFIILLRARARRIEAEFEQVLSELEGYVSTLCEPSGHARVTEGEAQEITLYRPSVRIQRVSAQLAQLEQRTQRGPQGEPATPAEQALRDDLTRQQQQLEQLLQGRDRAREESRLKSSYLHLLQRETNALFEYLGDLDAGPSTEDRQPDLIELRERLADIRALLANMVDDTPSHASPQAAAVRQRRVLVVDDGPVNLMLAQQVLEKHGLEVETASSGEEALALQQASAFDLVFMDIFMPEMDGLETSRRWRAYEKNHGIPGAILVALTANADNAGRERCLQAGMNDLITKPYQPESLMNKVAAWFPDDVQEVSS